MGRAVTDTRPAGDELQRGWAWLRVGMLAVAIGGVLAFDRSPLAVIAVLFVLVVPFEKLFPRHDQPLRRPGLATDLAYALTQPLLAVIGVVAAVVIGIVSLAWIPGLMIRPLVATIPPAAMPFVGIALFDFAIYWAHRWSHEVGFLWRFHSIHHSSERMDWLSGIRNHPFDGAILAPPFFFLLGAGFTAEFTGLLAIIQIVTGIFLHANVRWRWRALHRIVITPEFHHWHHANEPDAIHTNYSVFLPVWDILFGTYFMPEGRRPGLYGVDEPMPADIVGQLRHPLRGLRNPLRMLRHPVLAFGHLRAIVRSGLRQVKRSTLRPRHPVGVPF